MSSVAPKHYLHNEEVTFNGGPNRVYTGCFEVTIKLPVKKAFSSFQCGQNVLLKGWLANQ